MGNIAGKKQAGSESEFDDFKILELTKCSQDFFHFLKYCKIVTDRPTNPDYIVELRDYQIKTAKMIIDNRFSCILMARQAGKCQNFDTIIKIRNKNTGEIKEISIGELYNELKSI